MDTEKATRTEDAQAFLSALFGDKPNESFIQIWSKETKTSQYLKDIHTAAVSAVGVNKDAYVGVSLVSKNLGRRNRGTNKTAAAIPGVWADIDVNGGPENKKGAAPSFEAALELANAVLPPTLLVHSGYGLQAWWLLEDLWIFRSIDEQTRAAQIAAGWIARLQSEARERGFRIDATQDLARLMRVPGTFNGKGGLMAPVVGYDEPITEQDGKRYSVEVLSEHGISAALSSVSFSQAGEVDIAIDFAANPSFDKLEMLREINPKFDETWKMQRPDKPSWTASEYCLSLASFAVHAQWEDQEIADLMIAFRRKHGKDFKVPDWYARTIRKARHDSNESRREQTREAATEELVQIGQEDAEADPDHVVSLFSDLLGGKFPVKEVIQSNLDPKNAIFRLILSNGQEIPLDSFANLYDPNKFAQAFGVVTGHVPQVPKKDKWVNALNGLLKARVIRGAELTTTRSQVLSWLRDYVSAQLTEDVDEACMRRDPFVWKGEVWISPKKFHGYVARQMRQRTTYPVLEEVLDTLGFEKKLKNYTDHDRDNKRTSTTEYYRAPVDVLEGDGIATVDDDA